MELKQRLWQEGGIFAQVLKEELPSSMLKRYISEKQLNKKDIIYFSQVDVKTFNNLLEGKPVRTKTWMRILCATKMDPYTAGMIVSKVDSRMSEHSRRNFMFYRILELARYAANDNMLLELVDMVKHL